MPCLSRLSCLSRLYCLSHYWVSDSIQHCAMGFKQLYNRCTLGMYECEFIHRVMKIICMSCSIRARLATCLLTFVMSELLYFKQYYAALGSSLTHLHTNIHYYYSVITFSKNSMSKYKKQTFTASMPLSFGYTRNSFLFKLCCNAVSNNLLDSSGRETTWASEQKVNLFNPNVQL